MRPLAAAVLAGALLGASPRKADLPNIVVILADDLGWGSLGCAGADPKLVKTPHCDRLAREGLRCTDANTPSAVCTPTRYGLLTGRYCWRTPLKQQVLGVFSPLHIETDRLTLASLLRRRGYATAAVGKWHLGYGTDKRCDYTKELKPGPLEIGFDYHFGVPSNHGDVTGVYVENHQVVGLRSERLDPKYGKTYYGPSFIGLDAPQRVDEEVMDTLAGKAAAWLERQTPDKPFFLYFASVAVHEPTTPSARTKGANGAGPFGDWIQDLDLAVGRILEALDRKGFARDTLVIFTSDNGGVNRPELEQRPETAAIRAGLAVNGPFRGGKWSVFQGGSRVPFLVRWPGKVAAGGVCEETFSLVDVLATVAAIVGEPLSPRDQGAEDSWNVLPAWLGKGPGRPPAGALVVHSADGNFGIRQGPWKWIEGKPHPNAKPGALKARAAEFRPQLYNVADDPGEERDLLQKHPEKARGLEELLNRYRDQGFSRP